MSTISDVLSGKSLGDLTELKPIQETAKPNFTKDKVELVLKCLRWQNGALEANVGEGEENLIGLGDKDIADKAGLTLEQVQEIKAARDAKIAELTNPEPIE